MKRMYWCCSLFLILFGLSQRGFSATVDWNRAFVLYEGIDVMSGVYERYTMGSPYLCMMAERHGDALRIWAQPEANLVAANTFVLVNPGDMVSPESIYNSSSYFAYAVYLGSLDEYEERTDYSLMIHPGESIYLGFANQSATLTDPVTCGWVELGFDGDGVFTAMRSAWDMDGDPLVVGAIPEPSSAVLLLVGLSAMALRRRRMAAIADGTTKA